MNAENLENSGVESEEAKNKREEGRYGEVTDLYSSVISQLESFREELSEE